MTRNPAQVFFPLLRTKPCTCDIYKINEDPYGATSALKHSLNYVRGPHAHKGQISIGIDLSSRQSDLTPAESGIYTEF